MVLSVWQRNIFLMARDLGLWECMPPLFVRKNVRKQIQEIDDVCVFIKG